METLVSRPAQPGDGTFLLHSSKPGARRRQRRGSKRQGPSLLTCEGGANFATAGPSSYGRNVSATFLSQPPPFAAAADQPRTIAVSQDEKLLSASATTKPPAQAATSQKPSTSATPPDLPSPSQNAQAYTTTHPKPAEDFRSMATMTTTKALPPHLRPHKSTSSAGSVGHHSLGDNLQNISEKLAQQFNVTVSAPKPVKQEVRDGWSTDPKQDTWNGWNRDDTNGDNTSWGQPKQDSPGRQKGRGKGRVRGRDAAPSAPKTSKWAAKADFPKVDLKRHEKTNWDDSPRDNHSVGSTADGGWAELTKQAQEEWKLAGWDGKLAPAPTDWDSRPAFRPDQSADNIFAWMGRVDQAMNGPFPEFFYDDLETADNSTFCFGTPGLKASKDAEAVDSEFNETDVAPLSDTRSEEQKAQPTSYEPMGDIVPYYWKPNTFHGHKPASTFWTEVTKGKSPEPFDEGDLDGVRPWWEEVVKGGQFLKVPEQPHVGGPDPTETTEERLQRENDNGSASAAENRVNFERAKLEMERQKKQRKADKKKKLELKRLESEAQPQNLDTFKPDAKTKLFLRPARPQDATEIRNIYNHYVDNSCVVPEVDRRTTEDMLDRFWEIKANSFPSIVACIKGEVIKGRKRRGHQQEDLVLNDRVVGFAYANDFKCLRSIYRFTCEVEVFVDKEHYMKGIGKCLLEKIMAMLDPAYPERGEFPTEGDELDGAGVVRRVKNVMINFPYNNSEKLDWMQKWLVDWAGFRMEGHYPGIATKGGKEGHLAVFQYTTSEELDHTNLPIMGDLPSRGQANGI